MTWIALDIGGANLKAADGLGYAATRPFAIWRASERLAAELAALISDAPAADGLAVTMTAELADCYETKTAGVRAILDAVESVASGRRVAVYTTEGRFVAPVAAREMPVLAAASNWHALATFAARFSSRRPALLIDVGSTTTDIIPLANGAPVPRGRTDADRLMCGELVYTGVERTPVCALVDRLPLRGEACPVAAELFATTLDVYTLLGAFPEQPDNCDTADRRPQTKMASRARLARMVCSDADVFSHADALAAAESIRDEQIKLIEQAMLQVIRHSSAPLLTLLSGHGEFLARQALARVCRRLSVEPEALSLTLELGPRISRCAPAHALAILAREQIDKSEPRKLTE